MDSTQVFETPTRKRPQRPQRAIGPLFAVSVLLVGCGHFLLRRWATASALLLLMSVGSVGAAFAGFFGIDPVGWLAGRLAIYAMLFSMLDPAWTALESQSGRRAAVSPRGAALGALLAYGLPWLQLGDRGLGAVLLLVGGAAHVGLCWLGAPWTWLSEGLLWVLAFFAYRRAEEETCAPETVSTELGGLGGERKAQRGNTPRAAAPPHWLLPATLGVCGLLAIFSVGGRVASNHWLAQMQVDTERAISVEPYYRNAAYGLALEMDTPGWAFRSSTPDRFVQARHLGDGTQLWLGLRPRVPGFDNDTTALARELGSAMGYALQTSAEYPRSLGGLPGSALHARGSHGGQRVEVRVVTAAKGWRRYVLWYEWNPDHAEFAEEEFAAILAHLSLEGRAPESDSALAR